MKTFSNTNGRGFQIVFPNGVILSTQFGSMHYCENMRMFGRDDTFSKNDWESNDAEIAIIGPDGEWLTKDFQDDGDNVLGYVELEDWRKAFEWCWKWQPKENGSPEAKEMKK